LSAAVAELPSKPEAKIKTPPHDVVRPPVTSLAIKPAQYPTQDVPVHMIVRSETNRVPEVDDDFIESIRGGVNSPVLLRPIKATQTDLEQWRTIDAPAIVLGQTVLKLVFGERRWIAAKRCGHTHIPAIIRELTDTQALEIQIKENEDRQDYKAMDRAAAYAALRAQYMKDHHGEKGFTEEKCCDLIAQTCKNDKIKGRTVQQIIALGRLHKFCQDALNQGEMEASHAYELCRRTLTEEDQLALLAWIRKETAHSQDIPSIRRLKREIQLREIAAEDKRRQEKPFKDGPVASGGASVKLTFDGKTIDLKPGPLPTSVKAALLKTYPTLTTTDFVSAERVLLACGLSGKPFYLSVAEIQEVITTGIAAPQTIAPAPDFYQKGGKIVDEKLNKALPKPPTEAQIKRARKEREEEEERFQKQQAQERRNSRIDDKYRAAFFGALASKSRICSRLLTHVGPELLFALRDQGETPLEDFVQTALGWHPPANGMYDYGEFSSLCKTHTRKFTPNLLAALLITLYLPNDESEQLAKYFHVDPKKIRLKAAEQVKTEEREAKKKGNA
jgi:ParB/RepB/Spo0J family partition protein